MKVVRLIKVTKVCGKHIVWWSSCSKWSETKCTRRDWNLKVNVDF